MTIRFQDTKLLQHPTVETAFNILLAAYDDKVWHNGLTREDYVAENVKIAARFSTSFKNPDPDAVAALLLVQMMPYRVNTDFFKTQLNDNVARYIDLMYEDPEKSAAPQTRGGCQIFLATILEGQAALDDDIAAERGFYTYKQLRDRLARIDAVLDKIEPLAGEGALMDEARANMARYYKFLDDKVAATREKYAFVNTGLPDHPVVRKAYDAVFAANMETHGETGGNLSDAIETARVLMAENATRDPDILAAAILYAYTPKTATPARDVEELMHASQESLEKSFRRDRAAQYAEMVNVFGERIAKLHSVTSAFANPKKEDFDGVRQEADLVKTARQIQALERMTRNLRDDKSFPTDDHRVAYLEMIEDYADGLAKNRLMKGNVPDALLSRMSGAVDHAQRAICRPENLNVRMPGSPRRDRGNDW